MKSLKVMLSALFLMALSSGFVMAQEKLTKPDGIDNEGIDKFVNESFEIYDATNELNDKSVPGIQSKIDALEANIATVKNAKEKKAEIQTEIDNALSKTQELQQKGEGLIDASPEVVSNAVSDVPVGFNSVSEVKKVKENGSMGTKALKASVELLPQIAEKLQNMSTKLTKLGGE